MNYSTKSFNWKDKELYYGIKTTGFSIVPAKTQLYRVCWPDGAKSEDFYNISWAKHNAETMALKHMQETPLEGH